MKKLLFILALLCGAAFGQVMPPQVFTTTNTLTATGGDTSFLIKGSGINSLVLLWSNETGTISTCQIQIETSPDNVTFTQPSGGTSQNCTANSQTSLAILPANYIRVNLTTFSGGGTLRYRLNGFAGPFDPCANGILAQSQSVVNQAASTQELVATVAGTFPHVCGGNVNVSGPTSPTLQFKTGTNGGAPCNTSGANLGGTISPGSSGTVTYPLGAGNDTFFVGISGGEICATGGGTTPTIGGTIQWVRAPY